MLHCALLFSLWVLCYATGAAGQTASSTEPGVRLVRGKYVENEDAIDSRAKAASLLADAKLQAWRTVRRVQDAPPVFRKLYEDLYDERLSVAMADSGGDYVMGCVRTEGEAYEQLQYLAVSDRMFVWVWNTGGMLLHRHVWIGRLLAGKVTDLWEGSVPFAMEGASLQADLDSVAAENH